MTILLLTSFNRTEHIPKMHQIQTQTINYDKLLGENRKSDPLTISAFEISDFITYGQYKKYLTAIKSDSSNEFYKRQLPDTNMCLPDCYTKYAASTEFDNYPVIGISWEAAMNFCKWKTLRDNKNGEIKFIYRLPTCPEWIAAYNFLGKQSDMNKYYSDWLINLKDESSYEFSEALNIPIFSYTYFSRPDDPPVLKRKFVIGNSFLFEKENLKDFYAFSYYSFEGYRHISFRIVKAVEMNEKQNKYNLFDSVIAYWGLAK